MAEEKYPETISELVVQVANTALPLFEHWGWSYAFSGKTATRRELIETLEYLVDSVRKSDLEETTHSTGRFIVRKRPSGWQEGKTTIEISLDLGEVDI